MSPYKKKVGKPAFMDSYHLIVCEGATSGPCSPINSVFKNKQANIKAQVFQMSPLQAP